MVIGDAIGVVDPDQIRFEAKHPVVVLPAGAPGLPVEPDAGLAAAVAEDMQLPTLPGTGVVVLHRSREAGMAVDAGADECIANVPQLHPAPPTRVEAVRGRDTPHTAERTLKNRKGAATLNAEVAGSRTHRGPVS